MYNSLYFKIILILVIFMLTVMCVIGTILINSVNSFYMDQFTNAMDRSFDPSGQLISELTGQLALEDYPSRMHNTLSSYGAILGIDDYRDFYILDEGGTYLDGSVTDGGKGLKKTANLLAAMRGTPDNSQPLGSEFADYAIPLENGNRCIVYIRDSMDEMQQFTWRLFSIILQALMFGLAFAIILAFFLSKAITSPIQSLTRGAKLIASGEFSQELHVHSHDEIGTLTDTFNVMKHTLKSTLEEVSGEHQKLETIFTYLRDGVVAFAEDGKVLNINQSLIRLLGDKYNDSFDFARLIDLLGIENGESDKNDPLGLENIDGFNASDVMFDGRVLDVSFGKLRYTADNAQRSGVLAVIHDETGRYELDKSRREFVANVSHEMRTPLTSIKGACETILNDDEMTPDMEQFFLNMAVDECDRMTRIVSDLLVLSRLDNKRTQWNIGAFDPDRALIHLCEVMKVDAAAHSHELVYTHSKLPSEITADKERIEQVLINVLSNAIKYTPDGGKIELIAKPTVIGKQNEPAIEITVRDNGIGVPEKDIPHLFERFYRVDRSRTSETGGTGLGLAIAKEIIEAHGGAIDIHSKAGEGTTVTVILPVETRLKTVEQV